MMVLPNLEHCPAEFTSVLEADEVVGPFMLLDGRVESFSSGDDGW